MIRLIQALNYRCLRYIAQPLDRFHVLLGPNASGKTTFLDVVGLLGDLVSGDLEKAVGQRTADFRDLVWRKEAGKFELAIEANIPAERRNGLADTQLSVVRYEVAIGEVPDTDGELGILAEKVLLKRDVGSPAPCQRSLFPLDPTPPTTIITPKTVRGAKTVVNKVLGGNDNFYDETGKGWDHAFKLGTRRSALGNLPEDESKFPVATWLKALLAEGVQRLMLNSVLMRRPSPPGQPKGFRPDGSNLPWVVQRLAAEDPDRFACWIAHVREALPDLEDVRTVERPEDRHCYLVLRYRGGLEVPSWTASDGTLRLLALTLPAYLTGLRGVYLIEEPENGIHPRAVETVFQSLSSVYGAQILLASHSPVILSVSEPPEVLCFSKTESGATDIVRGTEHPALQNWQRETSLGTLFAAGVLG